MLKMYIFVLKGLYILYKRDIFLRALFVCHIFPQNETGFKFIFHILLYSRGEEGGYKM